MSIDTKKTREKMQQITRTGSIKYAYRQVMQISVIAHRLCDEIDRLNGEVEAERLAAKTANEALLAIKKAVQ